MNLQAFCPCGAIAPTDDSTFTPGVGVGSGLGGGGRLAYDACCRPLHDGEAQAETAERLMRSRYAAYAVGNLDYVFRTWHPRTRPDDLSPDSGLRWTGLTIVDTTDGGPDDETGEVEFVATFTNHGTVGELHERSRFSRRARRWVYVDGTLY
ncbi:YchJ family protein [Kribbella deserti]|uniref:UPF0225 protein ACFFGN_08170 n=1 Tax=Kribbella deserti TaxID=1926257 RepID=A0ABV6QHE5_9ACTN